MTTSRDGLWFRARQPQKPGRISEQDFLKANSVYRRASQQGFIFRDGLFFRRDKTNKEVARSTTVAAEGGSSNPPSKNSQLCSQHNPDELTEVNFQRTLAIISS